MKRRLEVARALLHNPKILFLDEPTLGLDPQTRNHIWSFIQILSKEQNVTVFFTTHYMEEADRVADEIAVIDHGKIVAQDSPAALKEKTQSKTLEEAFIALTGHTIRDEEASSSDSMRMMRQVWRGRDADERDLHSLATGRSNAFFAPGRGSLVRSGSRCCFCWRWVLASARRFPERAAEITSSFSRRASSPWESCSLRCSAGSKSSGTASLGS